MHTPKKRNKNQPTNPGSKRFPNWVFAHTRACGWRTSGWMISCIPRGSDFSTARWKFSKHQKKTEKPKIKMKGMGKFIENFQNPVIKGILCVTQIRENSPIKKTGWEANVVWREHDILFEEEHGELRTVVSPLFQRLLVQAYLVLVGVASSYLPWFQPVKYVSLEHLEAHYRISIPRTQMTHILEDLTHRMDGQPPKKEVCIYTSPKTNLAKMMVWNRKTPSKYGHVWYLCYRFLGCINVSSFNYWDSLWPFWDG